MRKEIWKRIINFEDYEISNFGRIKSFKNGKEIIKSNRKVGDGYLQISLYKEGKYKQFLVHRIVALYFIPNPENKPEVNHKKGIKTDNRAWMLEWITKSENEKHAHKLGLKTPINKKAVIQFSSFGIKIAEYESMGEAERQTGIKQGGISNYIKNPPKKTKLFFWKYK